MGAHAIVAAGRPTEANDALPEALLDIVRRPISNLLTAWNWKAAAISATIRASMFFATNLRSGQHSAIKAMLVEAGFAIAAAGAMGAVTQRLRATTPVWATGLVVWLAMPLTILAAQASVHNAFGTPHMKTGLIASFCFAAVASGFNWYAQRRGVMLAGPAETGVGDDLKALPRVVLEFVVGGPKALLAGLKRG